jgi:hypothetical protein
MVADSRSELDLMASVIGVNEKWIQAVGTYREHYDICLEKRRLAVKHGAIEITSKELGTMLREHLDKQTFDTEMDDAWT